MYFCKVYAAYASSELCDIDSCGSNNTKKDSIKHFDDIRNEQVLEGEEMKSILESHSEMLDYISKNSGRPVTNVLEVTCSFE